LTTPDTIFVASMVGDILHDTPRKFAESPEFQSESSASQPAFRRFISVIGFVPNAVSGSNFVAGDRFKRV
jgi:hypothetical protein